MSVVRKSTHVKYSERQYNTNVPPTVLVVNVETRKQELISRPRRAVHTVGGGVGIGKVATSVVDERFHVGTA
jgi:hypothetical protein